MKLILRTENHLVDNPLFIPSVINLIAMKNAFITKIPMLQNPTVKENSSLELDIHFEDSISEELRKEFQSGVTSMLTVFFQMSKQNVTISWK